MKKLLFLVAAIALSPLAPAADVASFAPEDGAMYSVSRGGKLVRVESFSPVSGGTFALSSVYSADVYTNAIDVATLTNTTYTVVETNYYTHAVTTNTFPNLSFVDDPGILGVTTNVTVSAVTNTWKVYEKTVASTNAIASGTASGHLGASSLTNAVYLAPGEKLLFAGTAVGGWLRLIFE